MNAEDEPNNPSVDPTVHTFDQSPGTQLRSPGIGKRRKPGRPPGSKNKAKAMMPSSQGIGLRNRTVFLPWNVVDISDSSEDEKNEFRDVHDNGSEWEDNTSDTEKYESKVISEQRQAYRKGVRHMTQLIREKGPTTKRSTESRRQLSSSPAPRRTGVWNQAKGGQLNDLWEHSLEKAAMEHYSKGAHSLLAAWKMSLQLFGIDPPALISMYRHMEFENSTNECFDHHGEMKRNPLWSHEFCRQLTRIMAHPLFTNENDHRFIPILIRWAVICRVDDGHEFTELEQRLLDDVCVNFRPPEIQESIVKRFQSYQQKRKDDGRIVSRHAQLMSRIVDYSKTIKRESADSFAPVKTRDLTVIIKALDSLDRYTANMSCETYFLVYSASKRPGGYPVGLPDLSDACKISWINLQRRRMPDYNEILLTTITVAPNDRANRVGLEIEEAGELDMSPIPCSPIPSVDGGESTAPKANEPPQKPDGDPLQNRRLSRSPSKLEDGEIRKETEANKSPRKSDGDPFQDHHLSHSQSELEDGEIRKEIKVLTSTHNDDGDDPHHHLHESPKSLVRIDQLSGAPAQSEPPKPSEITTTQPSANYSNFDELDKLLLSHSAPTHEVTKPRAPEAVMTLPLPLSLSLSRTRDPYRDPAGLHDNDHKDGTEGGFRNVDELFERRTGKRNTGNEVSTPARDPRASSRHEVPLPSLTRKRDYRRDEEDGYTKRRKFHGWSRDHRHDRRDSADDRRGAYQPQRYPASQPQRPAGPRAWHLEQRGLVIISSAYAQDTFELSRRLDDSRLTIFRMQQDIGILHEKQREITSQNRHLWAYNSQLRRDVSDLRTQLSYTAQDLAARIQEQSNFDRLAGSYDKETRLQGRIDEQNEIIEKLLQDKIANANRIQTLERSQIKGTEPPPQIIADAEPKKTKSQKRRERRQAENEARCKEQSEKRERRRGRNNLKREKNKLNNLSTPASVPAPAHTPAQPVRVTRSNSIKAEEIADLELTNDNAAAEDIVSDLLLLDDNSHSKEAIEQLKRYIAKCTSRKNLHSFLQNGTKNRCFCFHEVAAKGSGATEQLFPSGKYCKVNGPYCNVLVQVVETASGNRLRAFFPWGAYAPYH
ncbi:unnamed protein product [Fusarium graminearum]|uniref:Uncharacterized protein n=1 Tax=Gibberella zeae TaxID=5518 RepID=A0A8H3KFV1_GIBZA|nr:unnamed protein product [Fusarium graminearum]CAG1982783.1 unnamed protein product [Fusarium graminearum]CAG2001763.1 unnamed protein product [Fusarium graminearum]